MKIHEDKQIFKLRNLTEIAENVHHKIVFKIVLRQVSYRAIDGLLGPGRRCGAYGNCPNTQVSKLVKLEASLTRTSLGSHMVFYLMLREGYKV